MSKNNIKFTFKSKREETEDQWISISDIMTVLMIIFLFISILYIKKIQQQMQAIKTADSTIQEISKESIDHKKIIYDALKKEFDKDLEKWDAELLKNPIVIRFLSPEIMFHSGKSTIQPYFKNILMDFCPRYFTVLSQLKNTIEEIRIEGHTSFEWHGAKTKLEAYFNNLKLSQNRTISVLEYCITIKNLKSDIKNWTIKHATANGLSSSKPLCFSDSVVCRSKNRRVEFRAQIKSESFLDRINESLIKIQQQKGSQINQNLKIQQQKGTQTNQNLRIQQQKGTQTNQNLRIQQQKGTQINQNLRIQQQKGTQINQTTPSN